MVEKMNVGYKMRFALIAESNQENKQSIYSMVYIEDPWQSQSQ